MNGVKVGQFTKSFQPSSVKVVGVGFKPRFLLLWPAVDNGLGSSLYANYVSFAGVNQSGAIVQCGVGFTNYNTGGVVFNPTSAHPIDRLTLGTGAAKGIKVLSFDTDGFTVDVEGSDWSGNVYWHYMAIYGPSTSYATIKRWTTNTSSGNQAVNAGTASAPSLVIHLTAGIVGATVEAATNSRLGIGMMTSAAQWAVALGQAVVTGTNQTNRQSSASNCLLVTDDDTDTTIAAATYVSMDTNGFTVNFASGPAQAIEVSSICIVGLSSVRLGTFNKATAAAPTTNAISGIGIAPDGVFLVSVGQTTSGTVNASARLSLGAGDNTNDMGIAYSGQDASATPVRTTVLQGCASAIKINNDTSTIDAMGYISSLDATGFTVTWDINDAVATEWFYLAVTSGLPSLSLFAGGATAGDPLSFGYLETITAQPNAPAGSFYSAQKGQLWIDTAFDPPVIRVGNGYRWEKVLKPFERQIGVAGAKSTNVVGLLVSLAAFQIEAGVNQFSALRLFGKISTTNSCDVFLRINQDPNVSNLIAITTVPTATPEEMQIYIPPVAQFFLASGFSSSSYVFPTPYTYNSTGGNLNTAAGNLWYNSLALSSNGLIESVEIVAKSAAAGTIQSFPWTLMEQPREFFDYA